MKKIPWDRYNRLIVDIKNSALPEDVKGGLFYKMQVLSSVEAIQKVGADFRKELKRARKRNNQNF